MKYDYYIACSKETQSDTMPAQYSNQITFGLSSFLVWVDKK